MKTKALGALERLLGEPLSTAPLSLAERRAVGWLANLYDLRKVSLHGHPHLLAFAKAGMRYTPAAVAKQFAAGSALGVPYVFVPQQLAPHDLERLVANRVPFVTAVNGIFLPKMGLLLPAPAQTRATVTREHFAMPTQQLVIGCLLKRWGNALTLAEASRITGFSAATVVHAFQELVHFGVGERERLADGRTLRLCLLPPKALWERSLPRFVNPCKRTVGVTECPKDAVIAGVDALAAVSDLNEAPPTCFAIALRGFTARKLNLLSPELAPYQLQLWTMPPCALGEHAIDPISLYLSLRDHPDDRVQIQRDKLLEALQW